MKRIMRRKSACLCFSVVLFCLMVSNLAAQMAEAAHTGPFVATSLDIDLQYTYRSSNQLIEPYNNPSDYRLPNGIDYYRDYLAIPPFAVGKVDFGGFGGFSGGVTFQLKQEWEPNLHQGYFTPTNFVQFGSSDISPLPVEHEFLTRGVINWVGKYFDVSLGRDAVHYGDDIKGSIMINSRLPYFDAIRGGLHLGAFQLESMVSTLESKESWAEELYGSQYDIDPNSGNRRPRSFWLGRRLQSYDDLRDLSPHLLELRVDSKGWCRGELS